MTTQVFGVWLKQKMGYHVKAKTRAASSKRFREVTRIVGNCNTTFLLSPFASISLARPSVVCLAV